ncbi:MAG: aspartyl/glutamyl-tRNA amidotransferase subunit C [Candidatus Vogelbacteria bacterium]|nr:aspartyl/glutamyl-tRNA amidotransferase subunit C [Candidatus Vogelbacteria bacterium]
MISGAEIDKLAALARLELPPAEKEIIRKDLAAILDYMELLRSAPSFAKATEGDVGTSKNVLREDKPTNPLAAGGDYFKVKKIL